MRRSEPGRPPPSGSSCHVLDHALCWIEDLEPWILEDRLIAALDLPLNLEGNARNPFHAVLTSARAEAKLAAARLPIRDGF